MSFPEAQAHDPIKEIAPGLFVVYGSVKLMPVVTITRNMAVVRHGQDLTLVNSVRMDEPGLQALEALGQVKHVLRLGPFHGMDDAFYLDRYGARLWCFEDGTAHPAPADALGLADAGELPFPDATLLAFDKLKQTEGVVVLHRGPGVLLTADALQSYSTPPHMPHTAWLTKKLLPLAGFPNKTIIGPAWLKMLVTDRAQFEHDLQRVLAQEFDQLLSAHGTFLETKARAEVAAACASTFG